MKLKNQILTKLKKTKTVTNKKNWNCDITRKTQIVEEKNSKAQSVTKTQNVTKHNNSKFDKIQMGTPQIVTKLNKKLKKWQSLNCDKTQKLKLWQNSKTQIVTELELWEISIYEKKKLFLVTFWHLDN